MLLMTIADFVTAEEIATLRGALARHPSVDGRLTAQGDARRAKRNMELSREGEAVKALDEVVAGAIRRSARFAVVALPKATTRPIYSRYAPGMAYGPHVDDAIMSPHATPLRTDLAVTIFLSESSDYDGGQLVIEFSPVHGQRVKLPAGAAVIYPANTVHRARPSRAASG
ncbi:MAG: hypothetical protein EXQ92_12275 [Alphaproteobacteria bacterium]|nr:hypothetical protein [Alphaproteobacteria bacterium]